MVVGFEELRRRVEAAVAATPRTKRTIVGIAGPPASGKSTTASILAEQLSAPVVPMDGFHLSDRLLIEDGLVGRKGSPETFDVDGFVAQLDRLKARGQTVYCPNFDRSRSENSIGSDIRVGPDADLVIVEGNYLLLDEPGWSSIRQMLTLSVFVELDNLVRLKRLAVRHVATGKSLAEAWSFIRQSDEPNARRIESSKQYADLLLQSARD